MIDFNPTEKFDIIVKDSISLGCYVEGVETIQEAQASAMERLIKLTPKLKKSSKILFLSDRYIYAAFYIAVVYNSKVHILCSTIEKQQDILRQAAENNLTLYIQTSVGESKYLNFDFDYFDFVWSINAVSESNELVVIMREIKGVLAPQGRLIMLEEVLTPENSIVLDTHNHTFLDILKVASTGDLEKISQIDLKSESTEHYHKLAQENLNDDELSNKIQHHKTLTDNGQIVWNFIQFQKRNS